MIKKTGNKNVTNYVPKFPEKYKGSYPICVRSQWERMICQWIDSNPSIVEWSSESHSIGYYDPVQMKNRRYYPDFFAKIKTKDDKIVKWIIEVKPNKETKKPIVRKTYSKKTILRNEATYLTNQAKFKAAEEYCRRMGYKFKILTEREMFRK